MAVNQRHPLYTGAGRSITGLATAGITGGRFVVISGAKETGDTGGGALRVATAGANPDRVLGVSAHDAAAGERLPVYVDGEHNVTAGAAITAGQLLTSDGTGSAVPYVAATVDPTATTPQPVPPRAPVGIALDDAAAGAQVPVSLLR